MPTRKEYWPSHSTRLKMRAPFHRRRTYSSPYSSVLLSAFRNEVRQAIEFFGRDTGDFATEQRGHNFFRRALEKCFDKMSESGTACNVARNGGSVDVSEAVFFVADVPFLLQHAKLSAHCGVAGLVGKFREHLADRGALEFVENVHDLAFAAGQGV